MIDPTAKATEPLSTTACASGWVAIAVRLAVFRKIEHFFQLMAGHIVKTQHGAVEMDISGMGTMFTIANPPCI